MQRWTADLLFDRVKRFILTSTVFLYASTFSFTQTYYLNKDELYNLGVKSLQNGLYSNADSLLSLAIDRGNKSSDAYVNRAIARKKSGNTCGYCIDLLNAVKLKDKEANTAFWKDCTKMDSVILCKNSKISFKDTLATLTLFDSISKEKDISVFNFKGFVNNYSLDSSGNLDTNKIYDLVSIQEQPEFPGGDSELFRFLKQNTINPNHNKQGKVFATFVIDKDGSVTNVEIYKGLPGGPEFDKEVLRVIKLMPKWLPGKQNGKLVKVRFIMPINFKNN